ncbi:GL23877 [Drosophila persimilis]|uniref:GL23877 n=1 Tax=Drosophila persimilis TaxID=7234 RepID=B4G6B7_DROPE|nr:uncharacterized protein LOC6587792 [Drosophila persimilis]EDW23950.1 GL23877 [Drosophila persimilis]
MSLASIKKKEAKGKRKVLPKLRNILANPYKQHSPVLSDDEVVQFRQILLEAIKHSEHSVKTFATRHQIHLGLESSLRAINSRRFSCVFVSLTLRPSHIIRLIATSAAVKMPTAPIYAQPKLEELTFEIFGVRALSLVLPTDLAAVSLDLEQWVKNRQKPAPQKIPPTVKSLKKRQAKVKGLQPEETAQKVLEQPKVVAEKQWNDDYISWSSEKSCVRIDQIDTQVETHQLGAALSNLAMRAKTKAHLEVESKSTIPDDSEENVEHMEVEAAEGTIDEDEFLPTNTQRYRPVSVHRTRPNPDKKPKKKRNKKQKQQPPSKTEG